MDKESFNSDDYPILSHGSGPGFGSSRRGSCPYFMGWILPYAHLAIAMRKPFGGMSPCRNGSRL
eukprot:scaffold94607_cov56-Attheya_sp.AAC.1